LKSIQIFLMVSFLATSLPVWAEKSPMASLQKPMDEVIRLLKDPQYKGEAKKEEQGDKIWVVIESIFDFKKISQLALGKFRKKFSPKEMDEFSGLFSDLLGKTYLRKVQKEFQNEKVTYLEETTLKKGRALVKTTIVRENLVIPVNYNMWANKGVWRIYDVKVEGVSLVKNYRTQFQNILFKKKPAQLIEQVRKKIETLDKNKKRETEKKQG